MRDIQSPTGLDYRIHETPEGLAVLTPRVAQESEIWIDIETGWIAGRGRPEERRTPMDPPVGAVG